MPKFVLKLATWTELLQLIRNLNSKAQKGVSYKLFILGRHGEGYRKISFVRRRSITHSVKDNVAEAKYGTQVTLLVAPGRLYANFLRSRSRHGMSKCQSSLHYHWAFSYCPTSVIGPNLTGMMKLPGVVCYILPPTHYDYQ